MNTSICTMVKPGLNFKQNYHSILMMYTKSYNHLLSMRHGRIQGDLNSCNACIIFFPYL